MTFTRSSYCHRCCQTTAFQGELPLSPPDDDYTEIPVYCPRCKFRKFARLSRAEWQKIKAGEKK